MWRLKYQITVCIQGGLNAMHCVLSHQLGVVSLVGNQSKKEQKDGTAGTANTEYRISVGIMVRYPVKYIWSRAVLTQ